MDFVAICLSILFWLIRPQDWMSGMSGVGFMTWIMLAAIIGVAKKHDGMSLNSFFRSPTDWLVAAYLLWIIWTTGDYFAMAKAMFPFAAFYYITTIALNSRERLSTFISCWVAGLSVVAVFGLSTYYNFELAPGSAAMTAEFLGRLTLNTWLYNNPNSLGHGVVAVIPLAYIWLIWKRPVPLRLLGFAIIWVAAECVYQTQSKGAYICGAAAVTVSLIFRKPKVVQLFTLLVIMTMGVAALKMLPRMETLDDKEAGISGRLIIWQMAHNAMTSTFTGEGWKKFEAWVDTEDYGLIRKATHGSYVNVGADLGFVGLFFFVAIFYANGRTLFQARPDPEDEMMERSQRALLSLTTSFAASAWMIDRAYHTDYFLLAGAVAAFHRLLTGRRTGIEEEEAEPEPEVRPAPAAALQWLAMGIPVMAGAGAAATLPERSWSSTAVAASAPDEQKEDAKIGAEDGDDEGTGPVVAMPWQRLSVTDLIMCLAALGVVLYIWERIMTNFIAF